MMMMSVMNNYSYMYSLLFHPLIKYLGVLIIILRCCTYTYVATNKGEEFVRLNALLIQSQKLHVHIILIIIYLV